MAIFSCFCGDKEREERNFIRSEKKEKKLPLHLRILNGLGKLRKIFQTKESYVEMGVKATGIEERSSKFVVSFFSLSISCLFSPSGFSSFTAVFKIWQQSRYCCCLPARLM